jgi:small subunit ribosomal protein S19
MTRSKWKGPYSRIINKSTKKHLNLIAHRNSEILPKFIEKTFNVYNGKTYTKVTVTEEMINHKFGEFAFTRTKFTFKKKNKK